MIENIHSNTTSLIEDSFFKKSNGRGFSIENERVMRQEKEIFFLYFNWLNIQLCVKCNWK